MLEVIKTFLKNFWSLDWRTKIIIVLGILIVIGFFYIRSLKSQNEEQRIAIQNELAEKVKYQRINDSLGYAFIEVSDDFEEILGEKSELLKTIKKQKQQILALATLNMETKVESVTVSLQPTDTGAEFDTTLWHFADDTSYFHVRGLVSAKKLYFWEIESSAKIYVSWTDDQHGLLRGFVYTKNPYIKFTNASFKIKSSLIQPELSEPTWKYYVFGGAGGAVGGFAIKGKPEHALIGFGIAIGTTFLLDQIL